ncbi:MAG TPA: manganese transporter, partial [Roseiarcus sp.]|nr:manganese transporter [Roseiarcus sp.]
LLCNDKPVLGPWVNPRWLNYFTGAVIAALVVLSIVLTASVLFPQATDENSILAILVGGAVLAAIVALIVAALNRGFKLVAEKTEGDDLDDLGASTRSAWRMPPLERLAPAKLSLAAKAWMAILRVYLVVAVGLVLFRIVMIAVGGS